VKPIIGRARFVIQKLRLPVSAAFCTTTTCLLCGAESEITRGAVMATFTIGNEIVAVVCDRCLDDDSRQRLAALRRERRTDARTASAD